jgi:hypothetical protein
MRPAMTIFLILAPFGAFGLLMLTTTAAVSLFVTAGLCLGIVAYDLIRGGSLKLFMAGAVIVFSALGGYITLVDGNWSGVAVRLAVDVGFLAIALLSIAIRLPFTLQYARENVDHAVTLLPGFMRANYIITWAWTGAIVLMLVADILMIYVPNLPLWIGLGIAFAARNCAVYFTKWYPQYRRAKYGPPAAAVTKS